MGLSNFRENWKRDSEWGRSVPEVPEDHAEPPRNTITTRFDGNHGSWMAPLAFAALIMCLLATLSTPLVGPLALVEMNVKPDYPGGSGTSQKVQIGLWGLCWDGKDGDCSKFRGVFSNFGGATASLPERFSPLTSILGEIPQPFLNAAGVFPIFANAYIYFGAIYALWSCTFFQQKLRKTVKWQYAAMACFHWVIIWLSISLGLMIGLFQKVKTNVASSDMKDFVDCQLGDAGGQSPSLVEDSWRQISKDEEAQNEKRNAFSDNMSDCSEDSTLPTYTAAPSTGETFMPVKTTSEMSVASNPPSDEVRTTAAPVITSNPSSLLSQENVPPAISGELPQSAVDGKIATVPSLPPSAVCSKIATVQSPTSGSSTTGTMTTSSGSAV
ncbi:hypothetical protein QFC22_005480 [Naganishia vaughanmartiniae]|uniref:Uncharacterized protein n=1 Tax=Naganishia vaughanmartiniae TaxID=1424756 RepID=A0ACC2WSJ2_9TREE|nr:hypothetical protein QFC22_005480 [Naganishia vaughanmartiniae]